MYCDPYQNLSIVGRVGNESDDRDQKVFHHPECPALIAGKSAAESARTAAMVVGKGSTPLVSMLLRMAVTMETVAPFEMVKWVPSTAVAAAASAAAGGMMIRVAMATEIGLPARSPAFGAPSVGLTHAPHVSFSPLAEAPPGRMRPENVPTSTVIGVAESVLTAVMIKLSVSIAALNGATTIEEVVSDGVRGGPCVRMRGWHELEAAIHGAVCHLLHCNPTFVRDHVGTTAAISTLAGNHRQRNPTCTLLAVSIQRCSRPTRVDDLHRGVVPVV